MTEAEGIVIEFNDRINGRDAEGLSKLMTDDHAFIDSAGARIVGRAPALDAWRAFFAAFPDYRNDLRTLLTRGDRVAIRGVSTCSDPRLHGPALWTARTREGRISEWRVYEDTAANRESIGLGRSGGQDHV